MMLWTLLACEATLTVTPEQSNAFGYTEVVFDLAEARVDAAAVTAAELGGVPLVNLRAEDQTLRALTQGHPEGGAVALTLHTPDGEVVFPEVFTFAPPYGRASPLVVMGASISMGVQDYAPTQHSQLGGPAARIARLVGAWMPLPLLAEPLFTPLTVQDLGAAPECEAPSATAWGASSLADALEILGDPPDARLGRASPDLDALNVAVPGTTVRDLVYGPEDDALELLVSHLVLDPGGSAYEPLAASQLDRVEALGPEVLLSFDLLGNDVVDPVLLSAELDVGLATPLADLEEDLEDLFYRLDALGAEVFVATTPDPTWLPQAAERAQALRDAGVAEDEVQARLDAISQNAQAANALLLEQAGRRSYLHIVDLYGMLEQAHKGNLQVDEQPVSLERFGGLLSLDGFHLSDTGNALVADAFLGAMSVTLGEELERPDLAAVLAADPHSRDSLAALYCAP